MQRTHLMTLAEKKEIINKVRDKLNIFLGSLNPVFSRNDNAYLHSNSVVDRLEEVVGCYPLSSEDKAAMPTSLYTLKNETDKITIDNLKMLVKKLDSLLKLEEFPLVLMPVVDWAKKELKPLLQHLIMNKHRLNSLYGSVNYQSTQVTSLPVIHETRVVKNRV